MTRSTARASCCSICAKLNSAISSAPRRASASSSCAASIARSPPLTATYIALSLTRDGSAWQRYQARSASEDHVEPARHQCGEHAAHHPKVIEHPGDGKAGASDDASSGEDAAFIGTEPSDLDDERR